MDAGVKSAEMAKRARSKHPASPSSRRSASSAPARWATASPMSIALGGLRRRAQRSQEGGRRQGAVTAIERNMARQVAKGIIKEGDVQAGLEAHQLRSRPRSLRRLRPRHRGGDRGRSVKRKIFAELCPHLKPTGAARHQHLLDLDHAARLHHRPARALHRHALHEPGAADGAGRADPRHRHRRRDVRGDAALRRKPRQDSGGVARISPPSSSTASCCR